MSLRERIARFASGDKESMLIACGNLAHMDLFACRSIRRV